MNSVLAGRKYDVDNIHEIAFAAGILNSIVEGEEYRKLKRKGDSPVLVQKLRVLNEILHTLLRTDNFKQAKEFYYTALEEIEIAEGSWKNDRYWEQKLNLLRSLARPDGHSHGSRRDQGQERSHVNYVRTEGICRKWNDQNCEQLHPIL